LNERTNEEWIADLSGEGPARADAIVDLRELLFNGLRRALYHKVDVYGSDLDALVDDFVQDATLKILDNVETFEGRSRFTTWAYKIAINVAYSELRRKRWRDRSLDGMLETDDGGEYTPSFVADVAPGPESTAAQADLMRRIRQMINEELSDKQRTVLISTALRGAAPSAVAERLDMKTNAVYKVLHDARTRLKQRLLLDGLTVEDLLEMFGETE
jgi:RNA polymerase sigma-70 factor (ECF subfamily)